MEQCVMVADSIDNLLSAMDDMTPEQLADVELRLGALRAVGGNSVPKPQADDNWVAAEFSHALMPITGRLLPLNALLPKSLRKKFVEGEETLLAFIREEFRTGGRLEELKVVRMFFRLAAADIRSWSRVDSWPAAMVAKMRRCSLLFDKHFPGYREAGLLPILVRKEHSRAAG